MTSPNNQGTHLRRLALAAVLGAAAMLGVASEAARAATYSITASSVAGYGVTRSEFVRSGCSAAFTSNQLNGLDGYVVDATPFAGRAVRIVWGSPVPGAVLTVEPMKSNCAGSGVPPAAATQTGSWTFPVVTGTRWLVVQPMYAADVEFTATAVAL